MISYSTFTVIALIIHVIINVDVVRRSKESSEYLPAASFYRLFLLSIFAFFLTDSLWGVFYDNKLSVAVYVDTTIYFVAMGATIFFWTRYVVKYLESKKVFEIIVRVIGSLFFAAEIILLIINIPLPILFRVDLEACEYQALPARNVMLIAQICMYTFLFLYSTVYAFVTKNKIMRRYLAISSYSLIMAILIGIQITDPNKPFYSIGLLLGVCILNTFVVTDTKEEYRHALMQSRIKEIESEKELGNAIHLAYTDPLTNVKNKHAYVEEEEKFDNLISKGAVDEFAIIVFDLNGLKKINDTFGHEAGDQYIIKSVKAISYYFPIESLYRYGGDEFVVILEDSAYKNRKKKLLEFNRFIERCLGTDEPIISAGMSAYKNGEDNTFRAVFNRADKMMYARKEMLRYHNQD